MMTPNEILTLSSKVLLKVTNEKEYHNGYQYCDGLNMLSGSFSRYKSCVPGGFYFVKPEFIMEFLTYGVNIRIIKIRELIDRKDFLIVSDGDKYRSNMVILDRKLPLSDPETYKFLKSVGVQIQTHLRKILEHAINNGFILIIKYLHETFMDQMKRLLDKYMVSIIINQGSIEIFDYVSDLHPHIKKMDWSKDAFSSLCGKSNASMIKRLISKEISSKTTLEKKMHISIGTGNIELLKYFMQLGLDLDLDDESRGLKGSFIEETKLLMQNDSIFSIEVYTRFCRNCDPEIFEIFSIKPRDLPVLTFIECITKAIIFENEPMIAFLIDETPNLTSLQKRDIITTAISEGNLDLVKKLIQKWNKSPDLHVLKFAFNCQSYQTIEFLLEFYSAEKGFDATCNKALKVACDVSDINMVRMLLEKGVDCSKMGSQIFQMIMGNNQIRESEDELHFFARFKGIFTEDNIRNYYTGSYNKDPMVMHYMKFVKKN